MSLTFALVSPFAISLVGAIYSALPSLVASASNAFASITQSLFPVGGVNPPQPSLPWQPKPVMPKPLPYPLPVIMPPMQIPNGPLNPIPF
jgi:hypothetical protein